MNKPQHNFQEWLKSYGLCILIFMLGINAAFLVANEYAAENYGSSRLVYDETYFFYLPGLLIFAAFYLITSILIRWYFTRKTVHLTWDVILVALFSLCAQFYVISNMHIRWAN